MMAVNVIRLTGFNLKFLTGLLNSALLEFWLRHKGKMQGHQFQIDKEPLLSLPLIKPDIKEQKAIESLVSRILVAKKKDPKADVSTLEAEIDAHVYRLYGLSADDIKIIEGTA